MHAIHDNWEELRRGEASFQEVQPRNEPGAGPAPRRPRQGATRRRLQRQIMVTAARAAGARSARSGRAAPPVSDPEQQRARARAAELLRQQRQGGPVPPVSKRAREGSDEDDDVPLAQRAARREAPAAARVVSPNRTSRSLQMLYSSMGVRGPAPDARDARLAALARPPPPDGA